MRHVLLLLLVLLPYPSRTHAQTDPDSVRHRNNCRLAQQVVETGRPAPHMRWALGYIAYCERAAWGRTLSAGIRRLRTSTDIAELASIWADTQWLRDAALFNVSMEIAADRSASTPARVYAIRALRMLVDPRMGASYEEILATRDPRTGARGGCRVRQRVHGFPLEGVPLPADHKERARELFKRIWTDQSEPEDVRAAAACF